MNILVTGSAGFLGTQVSQKLKELGHHVIGLDLKPDLIANQSITTDLRLCSANALPNFDLCIHLASGAGGILHNTEKHDLIKNEMTMMHSLKALCNHHGCKSIIFTSSINVFENNGLFHHDSLATADQQTPYSQAKHACEKFIENEFQEFTIIRPTNLFGANQQRNNQAKTGESHVIPDLLHKIKTQDKLEIWGDGNQVRNFLHVSDAAQFITLNLQAAGQNHYSLRSNLQLTIKDVAVKLMAFLGQQRPMTFKKEYLKLEPHAITLFNISKPIACGWQPLITSFEKGMCL